MNIKHINISFNVDVDEIRVIYSKVMHASYFCSDCSVQDDCNLVGEIVVNLVSCEVRVYDDRINAGITSDERTQCFIGDGIMVSGLHGEMRSIVCKGCEKALLILFREELNSLEDD